MPEGQQTLGLLEGLDPPGGWGGGGDLGRAGIANSCVQQMHCLIALHHTPKLVTYAGLVTGLVTYTGLVTALVTYTGPILDLY